MSDSARPTPTRRQALALGGAGLLAAAGSPTAATAATRRHGRGLRPPRTDWPTVNRDLANRRAVGGAGSSIDADTVAALRPRWTVSGLTGCTSVPAVVGDAVHVGCWDGTVRAFAAADGRPRWSRQVTTPDPTYGVAPAINASPAVAYGRLVVGGQDGAVYALAADDGRPLWHWQSQDLPLAAIYSSAVVVGRQVLVGTASNEVFGGSGPFRSRGSVVSLDLLTGRPRWRWYATGADAGTGAGCSIWSSPAVDLLRGLLFVGVGQNVSAPASPYCDSLVALDLRTGALRWHRQYTADDVFTIFPGLGPGPDYDVGASPNLFRAAGREVVGVGHKGGVFAVFERSTGAPVWARRLTPGSHLGGVMQTAAVGRRTVFVTSNTMRNGFEGTLTVFALDADDGSTRWQLELPAPGWGAVTLAGDVLLVPTITGGLYALRADDGARLAVLTPRGLPPATGLVLGSGPSVAGDLLFSGYGLAFGGPPDPTIGGGLTAFGV